MKDSTLNNKVLQRIAAFESIEPLQFTAEWNETVMRKIESVVLQKQKVFPVRGMAIVTIFFLLLNVGYLLSSYLKDRPSSDYRSIDLQLISTELLINPSSVTN